jgi:hypothetical protein
LTSQPEQPTSTSRIRLAPAFEAADTPASDLIEELERVVTEARRRFEAGDFLPALSSMAAIPGLHAGVVAACREGLDGDDDDEVSGADPPTGLYL